MPCRKCGYDLIGLDANPECPECGTLNLHAEPYRGVEVFCYNPVRHSKALLIALVLFAVFAALLLVDPGTRGSNPPQHPASRPYGLVLGIGAILLGGYAIARLYSSKGQVSLDWDNRKIILGHTVYKKRYLPLKRNRLEFEMRELRGMRDGSPLGYGYDIARLGVLGVLVRSKVRSSWTYLVFPQGRVYIQKNYDDLELLELRLSRLYTPLPASVPVSQRVFTFPLVLAIVIILGATGTLVWLAIRNNFWV